MKDELGKPSNKKKNVTFVTLRLPPPPPPPNVTKKQCIFLKKLDHFWGTFAPHFSPKFFFAKMTQNGLKWILNTNLVNVTF